MGTSQCPRTSTCLFSPGSWWQKLSGWRSFQEACQPTRTPHSQHYFQIGCHLLLPPPPSSVYWKITKLACKQVTKMWTKKSFPWHESTQRPAPATWREKEKASDSSKRTSSTFPPALCPSEAWLGKHSPSSHQSPSVMSCPTFYHRQVGAACHLPLFQTNPTSPHVADHHQVTKGVFVVKPGIGKSITCEYLAI